MSIRRWVALALLLTATAAQARVVADLSYGNNGQALLAGDATMHLAYPQWAVTPDHRLVVAAGESAPAGPALRLWRQQENGAPDTGFGSGGSLLLPFAGSETQAVVQELALLPGGQLLVLTETSTLSNGDGSTLRLSRHLADGSPDPSFNAGAPLALPLPPGSDGLRKMIPHGDGALIFVFRTDSLSPAAYALDVSRVRADGQFDPSFGSAGHVLLPNVPEDHAADALVLPDGGFQVLFRKTRPVGAQASANWWRRFRADGALDTSFGSGGEQPVAHNFLAAFTALLPVADGRTAGLSVDSCLRGVFGPLGALERTFEFCRPPLWESLQIQAYGSGLLADSYAPDAFMNPDRGTYISALDAEGSLDRNFGNDGSGTWRPPVDWPNYHLAVDGEQRFLLLAPRQGGGYFVERYLDQRGIPAARPVPALNIAGLGLLLLGVLLLACRRMSHG